MSNKTFDLIRFIAELILPFSALISGLTETWGFAYGVEIAATLVLLDAFMGAVIIALRKIYNKKQEQAAELNEQEAE